MRKKNESYIKVVDHETVESYNEQNQIQRKFNFDRVYNNQTSGLLIFENSVKRLVLSAFEKGYQHTIVIFSPGSLDIGCDLLGISSNSKPLEETLLYHTIKYIVDLSSTRSDLYIPLQIALVAQHQDQILDLFNDGKPLEAPCRYTIEREEL